MKYKQISIFDSLHYGFLKPFYPNRVGKYVLWTVICVFVTVHKSYASFSSRARCLCVCECVWACRLISADQRSSWFNHHHHHQLQLITPPLNTHHFLISFVRSLFVSPGCVWSRLRSSLVPSSFPVRIPVDLSLWIRHVTSALLFTALVWPSKSLRHYPVSLWTAPIISSIGLIKREPTRILFPCFYHDRTIWPINGSSE